MKYISRSFADKAEAFTDKEVISSKCYLCHKNLRKKIKWFTTNGRQYYAAAYCDKHGFIKYKNRIRKTDDGRVYIVKTSKFISADELDILNKRSVHIQELRKKKKQKG